MAKQLHYADSTVRGHLHDLLWEGRLDRRVDLSVPSPRGSGADRWYWRDVGIGEPQPTSELLCRGCVEELYADRLRYQWARTDAVGEREWQESEKSMEDGDHVAACDRCGSNIFEGNDGEGE
jgi:hypothetical protein